MSLPLVRWFESNDLSRAHAIELGTRASLCGEWPKHWFDLPLGSDPARASRPICHRCFRLSGWRKTDDHQIGAENE